MKVNGARLLEKVKRLIEERHLTEHELNHPVARVRRRAVNEILNGMTNRELVIIIGDALEHFDETHHDAEPEVG